MPQAEGGINEQERLAALNSYNILDTAEEKDFDELIELASGICQTPIALISLVDEKRQWFKSYKGLADRETPREYSFCHHAILSHEQTMIIPDARLDPTFMNNPLVTGNTKIVFYAGVPLVNEDGHALGTLCVIDHEQRTPTEQQLSSLRVLAKQVMDKLELRRKVKMLEKRSQELLDANILIQRFASMAAHDLKNPLSTILLSSQSLKRQVIDAHGSKLVDMSIRSAQNLVKMIDDMLEYSKNPGLLSERKQKTDLGKLLEKVLTLVNIPENFRIHIPTGNAVIYVPSVAFEQIFINLISNAVRYNDKATGEIYIRFYEQAEHYYFELSDNGIGIEEQYHDQIFEDHFTVGIKDRFAQQGSGIGLSTVKNLVKILKGDIRLESTLGEGTRFIFWVRK